MNNVNIVVMGKTGFGKSTLINAVLSEEVAATGTGHAITKKNEKYSKQVDLPLGKKNALVSCNLNMYDTVGLEIDNSITEQTLENIKEEIERTKQGLAVNDIYVVWFCVNDRSNRFESYEIELIKKLSIDYEIPFIIVLTQCISEDEGELPRQIRRNLPDIPMQKVLAKDYSTRGGKVEAFGVNDLLKKSINDYKKLRVKILEQKIDNLDENRKLRIEQIESRGKAVVSGYSSAAKKIGFVPGGCIPIVHGMCIKMISDLNGIAGIKSGGDLAAEVFALITFGIIASPFMAVPLVSSLIASIYVETVGDFYLEALVKVIHLSTDKELKDNELIKKRLKEELSKLKK
ncbi:GTPase domain-containing protein [Butyrivibrio sp. YAB3001]|uniref:GTPase domain-containing protein n=1 Tax=Butyrivibrio sp. YAB3001 TaxID=1520812 RepID=UPI0008F63E0B|nr:GTPase domain-containing protein [Butyrivibrio sp. YAB3001]SFC55841.1 50S ribosome-binding GTPase [Butyrivibrio sp. YAB3001]